METSRPPRQDARAKRAGARITREPRDEPYGHRNYLALDPEGHHWGFGALLRGAPA